MDDNLESRYKILKPLGRGGFGKVYKAKDQRLDNFVAIKKIVPALDDDPEILAMVREEAILTRKLEDHPNIVKIYDLLEDADQLAIIMEYINGVDLGKFIKTYKAENRYVPPRIALHVIGEVCKALNHAHTTNDKITGQPLKIVHRDVSPSNIMITFSGDVKMIDFGIAKAEFDARSTRTTTGRLKGKYHYLSPEHGRKIKMDGRSDIYPLGAVLYETLTGAKLFDHQNTLDLMDAARNAIIPSQKFESDLIPQEVKRIIKKAVAKDLDKRYQSAWAMYEDIDAILQKLGAKPAELKRELSEIMSKIPAAEDDDFDHEGATPLPPKPELPQETIPLKPPIIPPPLAITEPDIAGDTTKTVSISVPDSLRLPVTPAPKLGNFKKAALILAAVLAVAIIGYFLVTSKTPAPQVKFKIVSNVDSALVLREGQIVGTTPAEFFRPLDQPFALALYRAGYDTVKDFYYRGNEEFQVADNALWQYVKLQDSAMTWQAQGKFYKNVYFKTTPVSATVYVDNDTTPLGVTNQDSIRLFAGMRQITLKPAKGYQEESFTLSVDARLENVVNKPFKPPAPKPVELRRLTILAKDAGNKIIASARVVNVSDNTNAMRAVAVFGSQGTRRNVKMGVQNKVQEFFSTPAELELPRRAYKIKVAAPGGYLDKTQDIAPEQTGEVLFVLVRGPTNGVTIEVKEATTKLPILEGNVWICKGKKLSDCPKEKFDQLFGELNAFGSHTGQLRSGKYFFLIDCPGYEVNITPNPIEVVSGANLLRFELKRKQ